MKEYVVESLDRTGVTLLDTRTVEEYAGQLTSAPGTPQPDIYRKGRIPGAVHVAWDDGAAQDGAFKPVDELRAMYSEAGIEASDEVIPYCRLGSARVVQLVYPQVHSRLRQRACLRRVVDGVGQLGGRTDRDGRAGMRPPNNKEKRV